MAKKSPRFSTMRLVKVYLIFAALILIMMTLRPEDAEFPFLEQYNLLDLSSWFIAIGLVLTIAWKAWREYGIGRKNREDD